MKKRNLIITTLLVVAATAVATVSCKKEKQDQMLNNNEQVVQSIDNMDEYLMSFKKRLLSAEKGGETISLEQAERDLGNLLNFDFGDANYATDVFQYDTIHLKLTLNNGEVDLSQLAATYNEALDGILNIYSTINLPDKSVYAICCDFIETESKSGEERDVEIIVITRGNNTYSFTPHDTLDWKPQNWAGTCDGQFVNLYGAPEKLQKWVMQAQPEGVCANGGRVYYTEIAFGDIFGHHTYDSSSGQYMLFTSVEDDINSVCIPHEEMEYYFNNIMYYWNHGWITNQSNHSLLYIKINFYCILNVNLPNYSGLRRVCTWKLYIRHGKPNCSDTPVLPEM